MSFTFQDITINLSCLLFIDGFDHNVTCTVSILPPQVSHKFHILKLAYDTLSYKNLRATLNCYGGHQMKAILPMSLASILKGYPLPSQKVLIFRTALLWANTKV